MNKDISCSNTAIAFRLLIVITLDRHSVIVAEIIIRLTTRRTEIPTMPFHVAASQTALTSGILYSESNLSRLCSNVIDTVSPIMISPCLHFVVIHYQRLPTLHTAGHSRSIHSLCICWDRDTDARSYFHRPRKDDLDVIFANLTALESETSYKASETCYRPAFSCSITTSTEMVTKECTTLPVGIIFSMTPLHTLLPLQWSTSHRMNSMMAKSQSPKCC